MGIRVVMLPAIMKNCQRHRQAGRRGSGDRRSPSGRKGKCDPLPQRKRQGAMVGDGINDAPALTRADISIAIGAGTDIAIDAADVVLMKSRLSDVPAAIPFKPGYPAQYPRKSFWAFFYNIIGIPLAAGVWIPHFRLDAESYVRGAAMSLSSFCVVTNACG